MQTWDGSVPLYSIVKAFTAAAALRAWAPDVTLGGIARVPGELADLELGDVLAHRSGLEDYYGWADYHAAVEAREAAWPAEHVLERARVSAERGGFLYSNIGYLAVRMAIEERWEAPFAQALRTAVLDDLALEVKPFAEPGDWSAVDAPWLTDDLRRYDPAWVYPGTLVATVADAARALAVLLAGALGDEIPTMMRAGQLVVEAGHPLAPGGYGLGLMTKDDPATVVGHGGGGPGFALFAGCTADGSRWAGVAAAEGTPETAPIEAVLSQIAATD